jgi:hypothetical protein
MLPVELHSESRLPTVALKEGVPKGWKAVQEFAQNSEARRPLGLEELTGDFTIAKKSYKTLEL